MIKDDRIYQVLLKYNFDLFRGDKNITEYMRDHCNQFYFDICDAVQGNNSFLGEGFVKLLKGELEELRNNCSTIPEILELNDRGLIKATYEKGFQLFERMKPYFYARYSWRENGGSYYRIRQGDFRIKDGEDSKEKKMQLFHIIKYFISMQYLVSDLRIWETVRSYN